VTFLHFLVCSEDPLYQDYQAYCEAESDDLNKRNTGFLSALTIPQELETPIIAYCSSVNYTSFQQLSNAGNICLAEAPPVRRSTLWRDLEEVKASGLLTRLPEEEIKLQEVSGKFCIQSSSEAAHR